MIVQIYNSLTYSYRTLVLHSKHKLINVNVTFLHLLAKAGTVYLYASI